MSKSSSLHNVVESGSRFILPIEDGNRGSPSDIGTFDTLDWCYQAGLLEDLIGHEPQPYP